MYVTATIQSCTCYSQCWSGSKLGASDPCTSVSASWVCTCSDTFLSAVPHVRRYTEYHLTAGMHPHYSSGTGHVSQQSTSSNAGSRDTGEKLKIILKKKFHISFTHPFTIHYQGADIYMYMFYMIQCIWKEPMQLLRVLKNSTTYFLLNHTV